MKFSTKSHEVLGDEWNRTYVSYTYRKCVGVRQFYQNTTWMIHLNEFPFITFHSHPILGKRSIFTAARVEILKVPPIIRLCNHKTGEWSLPLSLSLSLPLPIRLQIPNRIPSLRLHLCLKKHVIEFFVAENIHIVNAPVFGWLLANNQHFTLCQTCE